MNGDDELEAVCRDIGHDLEKLAAARGHGLAEEDFIAAVLAIEKRDVKPRGLTLTASNTLDDWTIFKIKRNGANNSCAAFEFQPDTGEFRRVGSSCEES